MIIIDNASVPSTVAMLKKIQKDFPDKTTVIYNDVNKGIAIAQNQGIDIALQNELKWILFLDHDSTPERTMISSMISAFHLLKEKRKIAIIAPAVREERLNRKMKFLPSGSFLKPREFNDELTIMDVQSVISSGSLIRRDVFEKIGKFREDFFMDYVDIEFCLRLRTHGWKIMLVRNAILNHNLGELTGRYVLGRLTGVTNHSVSRRYTIFKNRVIVWKLYAIRLPSYIFFDIIMAFYDLIKIVSFEQSRFKKIKAACKGLISGAISR